MSILCLGNHWTCTANRLKWHQQITCLYSTWTSKVYEWMAQFTRFKITYYTVSEKHLAHWSETDKQNNFQNKIWNHIYTSHIKIKQVNKWHSSWYDTSNQLQLSIVWQQTMDGSLKKNKKLANGTIVKTVNEITFTLCVKIFQPVKQTGEWHSFRNEITRMNFNCCTLLCIWKNKSTSLSAVLVLVELYMWCTCGSNDF